MPGVDCRLFDQASPDVPFDGVSQGEVLLRGPWIIESYHKLGKKAMRAAYAGICRQVTSAAPS